VSDTSEPTSDDHPPDCYNVGVATPAPITVTCPARAAVAGNPSDRLGGAVLAIPVRAVSATVSMAPAPRFEIVHSPTVDDTFADLRALRRHVERHGARGARELVLATIHRATEHLDVELPPQAISVTTSIPRSVGLAGSSAIVIATIRALVAAAGATPLPPDELASLALLVESHDLGIPAGLQDRVVQAHDRPMIMRFGTGDARSLGGMPAGAYEVVRPATPVGFLVAHRADGAESSVVAHAELDARDRADDPRVRAATARLAALAESAASAMATGDLAALGAAMDGSFDARAELVDLRPDHVAMVGAARDAGAHVNYSGSGGAVTVLCREPAVAVRARQALHGLGCRIIGATVG
jgi:glucuronokinase